MRHRADHNDLNNEAAVAGWISSTDVMLLCVVMLLGTALAVKNQLAATKTELADVKKDKQHVEESKEQTEKDLRDRLAEAERRLEMFKDLVGLEKEELTEQLVAANTRISKLENQTKDLENELSAMKLRKQELDKQLADTRADLSSRQMDILKLKEQVSMLAGQITALTKQLDLANANLLASTTQRAQLEQSLAGQQAELEKAKVSLLAAKVERARLEQSLASRQADLDKAVEEQKLLAKRLADMGKLIADMRAGSDKDKAQLQKDLKAATSEIALFKEKLAKQFEKLKETIDDYNKLVEQYNDLRNRSPLPATRGGKLRPELVGLKGDMIRVAILLDTSLSMVDNSMKDKERWNDTRKIMQTWVEQLEMGECALIPFSADAHVYPQATDANRTSDYLKLSGNEANKQKLADYISQIKPHGGTNTLKALSLAYELVPPPDTIILFTDGAPNDGTKAYAQQDQVDKIYKLCKLHKSIPINAVGVGDYFTPSRDLEKRVNVNLAEFLMELKKTTGGSFLGR